MTLNEFSKMSRQKKLAYLNDLPSDLRHRTPGIGQGGEGAYFIFDDDAGIAYVNRYYQNKDCIVAVDSDSAESVLDYHIEQGREYADYRNIQFGDKQRWQAYCAAAEELIKQLKP